MFCGFLTACMCVCVCVYIYIYVINKGLSKHPVFSINTTKRIQSKFSYNEGLSGRNKEAEDESTDRRSNQPTIRQANATFTKITIHVKYGQTNSPGTLYKDRIHYLSRQQYSHSFM
jgi:hypothetical protein